APTSTESASRGETKISGRPAADASKVASEMLGHSTIAITLDLYSHVTPTLQRDAARAVDLALREAPVDGHGGAGWGARVAAGGPGGCSFGAARGAIRVRKWRRGRDSNPRSSYPDTAFPVPRPRPD